ncbi:hypothetical protein ACS386_14205 [Flavobacteriaceae bacterium LMO-SS05]
MDKLNLREDYWSKLKPLVGNMISNAPLQSDKHQYIKECWKKIEEELEKYKLNETDFSEANGKLRKQLEKEILKR